MTHALYPFLYGGDADGAAVLEQVRRSTAEKAREVAELRASVVSAESERLLDCAAGMAGRFAAGGRLLTFGNGGSSTDAQALATTFLDPGDGARPLPALSLTDDVAVITVLCNDVGFDVVFSRQIGAYGRSTDIALGLSTSGNSANLLRADHRVPFGIPGGEDAEEVPGGGGARVVRARQPLSGELLLRGDPLPGPFGGVRVRLGVSNVSAARVGTRDEALRHALVGAHSLVSLSSGGFLSLIDPPEWAAVATGECVNEGAWPVLVGDPERHDTVLCSPIILYDYPAVAEESPGELFDGTEIDEILTLRTMALTDEEKRQARATDERAAGLIDRVDHLPPELLARLHGAMRSVQPVRNPSEGVVNDPGADLVAGVGRPPVPWWDPGADASVSPETDTVVVAGVQVAKGSRVRLRPARRADAHDMFLAGLEARVEAVVHDVDGNVHLAVSLDGDLYAAHGRFRYFAPDEVEPL